MSATDVKITDLEAECARLRAAVLDLLDMSLNSLDRKNVTLRLLGEPEFVFKPYRFSSSNPDHDARPVYESQRK